MKNQEILEKLIRGKQVSEEIYLLNKTYAEPKMHKKKDLIFIIYKEKPKEEDPKLKDFLKD